MSRLRRVGEDGFEVRPFFGQSDGLPRFLAGESAQDPDLDGFFLNRLTPASGVDRRVDLGAKDGLVNGADVAVDRSGNAFLVWAESVKSSRGGLAFSRILGRTLSRAGELGPISVMSPPGARVGAFPPQLSVAPSGRGHLVWSEFVGSFNPKRIAIPSVRYRSRAVTTNGSKGSVTTVVRRIEASGENYYDVASFADGRGVMVWSEVGRRRDRASARAAVLRLGRAAPQTVRVSGNRERFALEPSVVAHGLKATVAWSSGIGNNRDRSSIKWGILSRSIVATGTRSRAVPILSHRAGRKLSGTELAANTQGRTFVTWVGNLARFRPVQGFLASRR